MSSNEAYNKLSDSTVEEIVSCYTKSQLQPFYKALFEFDIEHFDIHDEHIMDSLSFNKIIHLNS